MKHLKEISDLLAKWISISAAIVGGFFALNAYLDDIEGRLSDMEKETLVLAERFHTEPILGVRKNLDKTIIDYQLEKKITNNDGLEKTIRTKGLRENLDGTGNKVTGCTALLELPDKPNAYEIESNIQICGDTLREEITEKIISKSLIDAMVLIDFFEFAYTCNQIQLCNKNLGESFFKRYAGTYWFYLKSYIKDLRAMEGDNAFGQGLESFAVLDGLELDRNINLALIAATGIAPWVRPLLEMSESQHQLNRLLDAPRPSYRRVPARR